MTQHNLLMAGVSMERNSYRYANLLKKHEEERMKLRSRTLISTMRYT